MTTTAPRDKRPTVRPAVVRKMIGAASDGAHAAFLAEVGNGQRPCFPLPSCWGDVRKLVHGLPDDVRRAVVLQLVGEEAERIRHDGALGWGRE